MIALVVDDSMALRLVHKRMLEAAGWEVRTAKDGEDAITQLDAMPVCHLVMTDWHMPVMDGIELVKRIRQHPRYASVPVLMVTSEAGLSAIQEAIAAGATEVLMKPYTAEALVERVEEVTHA